MAHGGIPHIRRITIIRRDTFPGLLLILLELVLRSVRLGDMRGAEPTGMEVTSTLMSVRTPILIRTSIAISICRIIKKGGKSTKAAVENGSTIPQTARVLLIGTRRLHRSTIARLHRRQSNLARLTAAALNRDGRNLLEAMQTD